MNNKQIKLNYNNNVIIYKKFNVTSLFAFTEWQNVLLRMENDVDFFNSILKIFYSDGPDYKIYKSSSSKII